MSATTAEVPQDSTTTRPGTGTVTARIRHGRPARVRPARRSGRSLAPRARPGSFAPAPALVPSTRRQARACNVEAPVTEVVADLAPQVHTRLTDRGIAVILVAGAMIVMAALVVVGLTAVRVTSDDAQPLPASYASLP
jgi:hypothetical protein